MNYRKRSRQDHPETRSTRPSINIIHPNTLGKVVDKGAFAFLAVLKGFTCVFHVRGAIIRINAAKFFFYKHETTAIAAHEKDYQGTTKIECIVLWEKIP